MVKTKKSIEEGHCAYAGMFLTQVQDGLSAEGRKFDAELCMDGRRVGHVLNSGCGWPHLVSILDDANKKEFESRCMRAFKPLELCLFYDYQDIAIDTLLNLAAWADYVRTNANGLGEGICVREAMMIKPGMPMEHQFYTFPIPASELEDYCAKHKILVWDSPIVTGYEKYGLKRDIVLNFS